MYKNSYLANLTGPPPPPPLLFGQFSRGNSPPPPAHIFSAYRAPKGYVTPGLTMALTSPAWHRRSSPSSCSGASSQRRRTLCCTSCSSPQPCPPVEHQGEGCMVKHTCAQPMYNIHIHVHLYAYELTKETSFHWTIDLLWSL